MRTGVDLCYADDFVGVALCFVFKNDVRISTTLPSRRTAFLLHASGGVCFKIASPVRVLKGL